MVGPSARFEEIKIPLPDPVHGLDVRFRSVGDPPLVADRGPGERRHRPRQPASDLERPRNRAPAPRAHRAALPHAALQPAVRRGQEAEPCGFAMQVLRRTLRVGRGDCLTADPTAAPAHLFLGGKGLGAQVAADLAGGRRPGGRSLLPRIPAARRRRSPRTVQAEAALPDHLADALRSGNPRPPPVIIDVLRQDPDSRRGSHDPPGLPAKPTSTSRCSRRSDRSEEEVRAEVLERASTTGSRRILA